jgi:type IV fimbrial biogenesis protein FimT
MRKQRGFTTVELLIVMVISAILVALAAPSFSRLLKSNSMASGVNTFMSDMRYARSEAVRRGGAVVMCRSDSPEAANPVCNTGAGPGGNGWVSGWIVFHDLDNSQNRNGSEPVLRVQIPITSVDSAVESGGSYKFRFTATGRLQNLSGVATLQFGGGAFTNDLQRMVCVSIGGRARIAGDGTASCT